MAKRRESYFWTSYSDLMTSLFFVMLALFILTVVLLNMRMQATVTELEQIRQIVKSTEDLEGEYFQYNNQYEKFIIKDINVQFKKYSANFDDLDISAQVKLKKAGKSIRYFLNENRDIEYLVIVEGQASKDNYYRNYQLSYDRALSLVKFWKDKDILTSDIENCELLIAGSGDGTYDVKKSMRSYNEEENQRFLIYIIPKNILKGDK